MEEKQYLYDRLREYCEEGVPVPEPLAGFPESPASFFFEKTITRMITRPTTARLFLKKWMATPFQ